MWDIRKPSFIRRLTPRLGIEPGMISRDMLLSEVVLPVTNLDELAIEYKMETTYDADPGATGFFTVYTCPDGKLVKLIAAYAARSVGGTLTNDAFRLYNRDGSQYMLIVQETAAAHLLVRFAYPIPMKEGWTLRASVAAYTASDEMQIRLLFTEEDQY